MQDAIRDLRDIGAGHIEVINITKTPAGGRLDQGKNGFKEGVLFSTYMGLVSKSAKVRLGSGFGFGLGLGLGLGLP